MNEEHEVEKQDRSQAILWTALALGAFALLGAVLPFFYLKDALISG